MALDGMPCTMGQKSSRRHCELGPVGRLRGRVATGMEPRCPEAIFFSLSARAAANLRMTQGWATILSRQPLFCL